MRHAPTRPQSSPVRIVGAAAPPALAQPAHPIDRAAPCDAVRSEDLLRGRRAVDIVHGEARYRLSVTALGKLILTK